jgi:hypothetical protein
MGIDTRNSQFIAFFIFVFLLLLPVYETAMAIEEASYKVMEKDGDFEIRQYMAQIVAETVVEGDFDKVGNEGFSRLFGYISGNNTKKQSITMTPGVSQEADSEKIPMTAPVNQEQVGNKWHISFLMPSNYTLETLPEPTDNRVVLKQIPSRNVAAITYSGTWSQSRYEEHKAILVEIMRNKKLKPIGEYIFARYNPPFMPWFLRRNEVLVNVELFHE